MKNLTPMQAAYWTGRNASGSAEKVSAHLYVEFDCGKLEPGRFSDAVARLFEMHPMMRLRVTEDGLQTIEAMKDFHGAEIEDLTGHTAGEAEQRLDSKRRTWTVRQLDLAAGQACAIGLTLLPDGRSRLHVDTDMTAIDPPSFCRLMEDLARLYEAPEEAVAAPQACFFDWLDAKSADPDLPARQAEARQWWRERLAEMPPAPVLPATVASAARAQPDCRSGRLAEWLAPGERDSLIAISRDLRITPSALLLGLFAAVIGEATGSGRFRLNVPMFWRAPYVPDSGRLVGDFSNILILAVDVVKGESLEALCRRLADRLTGLLAHSDYPGVSVLRDLSREHRSLQDAPIVFTAGVGLPEGDLFSERVHRVYGPMSHAVSEGAQVALDAQVAGLQGGLLINWDIRNDRLPRTWIEETFRTYVTLVRAVAAQPGRLLEPLGFGMAPQTTCRAGAGGGKAALTEAMLLDLMARLSEGGGASRVDAGAAAGLALTGQDLAELAAFINHYVPAAGLVREDLAGADGAPGLAELIARRSGGASEEVARAYLEAVAPARASAPAAAAGL